MEQNKYWLSKNGLQTLSLALLAAIALGFTLSATSKIMIPFVLSLFLFFVLSPVKSFFVRKLRVPKTLALLMTFFIVGFLLTVITYVMISAVQEFATGYSAYEAKAIYFADSVQTWLVDKGLPLKEISFSQILSNFPLGSFVKGAGASVFNLFSSGLLVFIFLVFLFTGSVKSNQEQTNAPSFGEEVNKQIQKYLSVKLLTSSVTGVLTFVVLSLLGLDLAFVFGFMAFVLNFIPTIGSLFAVLLPLPVAFFQFDSAGPMLMVLLIPGAIQFVIGNVIEPRLMGQSLDIHPVTVLLSLLFWSLIWGVSGAFLAVPITAVLKILLGKIEGGNYIAQMMSGNFRA